MLYIFYKRGIIHKEFNMNDRDTINVLLNLFKEDNAQLLYLFWYGSREQDADIDLMAVTSYRTSWNHCAFGRLDLISIPFEEFQSSAMRFDPIVIEPLFTGELIFGDQNVIDELKLKIEGCSPSHEAITFLYDRAMQEYLSSRSYLAYYRQTKQATYLLWAFTNVTYAYSYAFIAQYYEIYKSNGPIILKSIKEKNQLIILNKIVEILRMTKRDHTALNEEIIEDYMERWRSSFRGAL